MPGERTIGYFCLTLIAPMLLLATGARADQVTIAASKDNTIFEENAANSNGAGDYFFAGNNKDGFARRALVTFNVAGSIPAGSTINSVTLTLYMSRTRTQNQNVTVHKVLADWGEGTSNAGGEEGGGAAATTGDATWSHRFYSTTLWTTAGGQYNATASATTAVGNATQDYTWSSAAMATDVQNWLNSPSGNFGWIVLANETDTRVAKRFNSRTNPDATRRPRLTINFTPPSPTGACCATDGSCSIVLDPGGACSGTYQGSGTVCTPNPCPQPTGACCLPTPTASCTQVSQSSCTGSGGTFQGTSTSCSPNPCPVVLTPFLDPLPVPAVAQPVSGTAGGVASYRIATREIEQQLHSQLANPTRVWGFGDGPTGATYPGPTVLASKDQQVTVTWVNDIRDFTTGLLRTQHYLNVDTCPHGAMDQSVRVTFHLHGAHVAQDSDGYPTDTFLPGSEDVNVYPNHQLPATLWYHDHSLGITRLNVYMGLAGFYLLSDPVEQALNLPAGEFEIGLAIQDRTFNPDGSLKYPAMWDEMFLGDKILVNGKVWPYLNVKKGKYRFRMLNGCNSRTLRLALSNGASFQVIGEEGGLLPSPVTVTQITLGPGERADTVIDFAPYATGTEILLTNSAPAPFPGTPGVGVIPNVMKFVVQSQAGDTDPVPSTLRPLETLSENDASMHRVFELKKGPADACSPFFWSVVTTGTLNGTPIGDRYEDLTEFPELGTTEVWSFVNRSGLTHPMHMHLVMFQVLDRQAFEEQNGQIVPIGSRVPPPAHEAGWKDTVQVGPNEIVRVIARFEGYTGKFPYHCHILEHEDHEMMRQFQTVDCGNSVVEPGEECDDGDTSSGNGCASNCDIEDQLTLQGVAQGGTVQVVVDGVMVGVTTTPGQTAAQVVAALAAAILANPTLSGAGVLAGSIGNTLWTTGAIPDPAAITDAGLNEVIIPTLSTLGASILAGGLALAALRRLRRARS